MFFSKLKTYLSYSLLLGIFFTEFCSAGAIELTLSGNTNILIEPYETDLTLSYAATGANLYTVGINIKGTTTRSYAKLDFASQSSSLDSGTIKISPKADDLGETTFTIKVCDRSDQNSCDTKDFSVNVSYVSDPAINGQCGSANSKEYEASNQSYESDQQCSKGTPDNTAFPEKGQSVSWNCKGENNGTDASCSASRKNDDVTPVSSVSGFSPTTATKNKSETFTIVGANLPDTLAAHIDDCANLSFTSRGTTQQTFTCTPNSVGNKSYVIKDKSGGNTLKSGIVIINEIVQPINGECGSANNKEYEASDQSYGSDQQCSKGSSNNTAFPEKGNTVNWNCRGENNGTDASCSASRKNDVTPPSVSGFSPTNTTKDKQETFTITGFNLPNTLAAFITDCSDLIFTSRSATQQTFTCTPSSVGTKEYLIKDKSGGTLLKNGTVLVTDISQPVNAQCGSAHGKTYPLSTDDNYMASLDDLILCQLGNPSRPIAPFKVDNTAHWICLGIEDGDNAECSAQRADIAFYSIEPKEVTINRYEKEQFIIYGENIPSDILIEINNCDDVNKIESTPSKYVFSCFPRKTRGTKIVKIKDSSGEKILNSSLNVSFYLKVVIDAGHGEICTGDNAYLNLIKIKKEEKCVNGEWKYPKGKFTQIIKIKDPDTGKIVDREIGIYESNVTLKTAKNIKNISLNEEFLEIILTRNDYFIPSWKVNNEKSKTCMNKRGEKISCVYTDDTTFRAKYIIEKEPSFSISLHTDGGVKEAHGTWAYYRSIIKYKEQTKHNYSDEKTNVFEDKFCAIEISNGIASLKVKKRNNQPKERSNVQMTGNIPNCLLEIGFHSNTVKNLPDDSDLDKRTDLQMLYDDDFLKNVASEIYKVIINQSEVKNEL